MTQPIGELTDRMREIFGLVVESYLARGEPIGSKALAGSISLSPASIRGVMQELEERGLLTHPHTSAGRVPTESGLRLFVDGIMQAAAPDPRERRRSSGKSSGASRSRMPLPRPPPPRPRGTAEDRPQNRPAPADQGCSCRGIRRTVRPVPGCRDRPCSEARDAA